MYNRLPVLVCLAAACGPGPTVSAPSESDPLYANWYKLWPAAKSGLGDFTRTDIAVCWENPERVTPAARDAYRRAIEESWSRFSHINFIGFGQCLSGSRGIRVRLCVGKDLLCPAFPESQAAGGYPDIDGMPNGVRMNPSHGPGVFVHEIGHTLGFYHEEERFNTVDALATTACDTSGLHAGWPNDAPITAGAYDPDGVMAYCSPPTSAPWLSPNDIAAIERIYGRRLRGTILTPRANCAAAHAALGSGDPAFLWSCDEWADDQEYYATTQFSNGDAFNLRIESANLCLEPYYSGTASPVSLWPCVQSSQLYDWRFEKQLVRGFGGLCLDVRGGGTARGTPLQMWECGALSSANQRFTRTRAGQLRFEGTHMCASVNVFLGNRLVLAACNELDDSQRFDFANGRIRRKSNPAQCLDVLGPNDAQYSQWGTQAWGLPRNGDVVQQLACNDSLNQRFTLSGAIRSADNPSLCLTRSADAAGSALWLSSCANGTAETHLWDYFF